MTPTGRHSEAATQPFTVSQEGLRWVVKDARGRVVGRSVREWCARRRARELTTKPRTLAALVHYDQPKLTARLRAVMSDGKPRTLAALAQRYLKGVPVPSLSAAMSRLRKLGYEIEKTSPSYRVFEYRLVSNTPTRASTAAVTRGFSDVYEALILKMAALLSKTDQSKECRTVLAQAREAIHRRKTRRSPCFT